MELVTGVPVSSVRRGLKATEPTQDVQDKIKSIEDRLADAICLLLSLSPPPDTAPEPVGGGRVTNFIFGRDEPDAPRGFADLEDLQTYVNEENKRTKPQLPPSDLVPEGLRLCYCDLNFDNFLLHDADDLSRGMTVIDFEHANWLPHSFLIWEIWDEGQAYLDEQIRTRAALELSETNL